MDVAITEHLNAGVASGAGARPRGPRPGAAGPDRTSVLLFSVAVFLAVLALLAWQLRATPARTAAHPILVVRRVYETKIVETIRGGAGASSVSQSVSSSGSGAIPVSAPTTRSSSVP